ncbi:MAG: PAS domain S-box protein [Desulfobacterales bacterium]|nr:PAS domain S-box protein [Desulfobacterales bacterium]
METPKNITELEKRIAELEKKVDQLNKEKEDYRTLFDSILFGVQEIDSRGTIQYSNAGDHRIHGYEKGELVGRSVLDFFETKAEKEQLVNYFQNLVQEQPVPTPWFSRDKRKDGEFVDVRIDWNYKRDQDGKVVGFISLVTDITEKMKLQKDLQESQTKFQSIFEHSPLAIMCTDENGTITTCNDRAVKLFGAPREKLIGFSYKNIKNKDMGNAIATVLTGKKSRFEGEYLTVTGDVLTDMRANFSPSFNSDNEVSGVIGIFEDISESKKVERDLKESEEKYSKIFNSEIDAISIFDAETREIIDCNEAFLKLYGYSRAEVLQLKADDISAEPEKTASSIKNSAMKGDTRIRRRRHKKKDGTRIIVDIASGPFMLHGRKVMFARLHDITKHVRDEEALHESEERFRIAFLTSPDSININKMDGTYVEINKGFAELTGYSREDVIGKSSIDINIWDDQEDRKTLVEGLQKSSRFENMEAQFRMKDGSLKTGLLSASVIQLHGEPHILSITKDISASKKVEREKEKLEAQLRQVYKMEAIGTMAGGIAHDFNNILTVILGNADLARYVNKDDGPAKAYIDRILEAADRAKEMVRQILAFSRKAKQDLVPIKPNMVFTETLTLLRSTIPSTIEIRQNFSPECRTIKADPTQLNQIMMNLSTNAVYAMDENGLLDVSLQEVELSEKDTKYKKHLKPGPYAMLTVTDTGKGMSNEVMERIFDPFFTTKKFGEGTGMGLSVVHGIVESHGGMISAESTPGKGTTFRLYFPIIDETAEQVNKTSPVHYKGNERILLIDDEESLVEIGAEILGLLGYRVTAKTNSLEAFEAFKTNPDNFDLVITDQTMPNMSGTELAVELLKIRSDISIVLCTGYSSKISDDMIKEIGIADYFMKPFDAEQLALIVRKTLDRT